MGHIFAKFLGRRGRAEKPAEPQEPRPTTDPEADDCQVVFGSQGSHNCLRISRFCTVTGSLSAPQPGPYSENPIYLTVSPNRRFLYTCNLISHRAPNGTDSVSAYSIGSLDGSLALLNNVSAGGVGPCHASLNEDGQYLGVANYDSGTASVIAISCDGHLGPIVDHISFAGKGIDPIRQARHHAHCVQPAPLGRFLLVTDLGCDRVWIVRFEANSGRLPSGELGFVELQPGDGPRHMVFHPNRRWLYVNGELGNSVSQFEWDGQAGTLANESRVGTIPPSYQGSNTSSELRLDPQGNYLYVSNRGHDSLAVFAVERRSGRLDLVEHVPCGGCTPRSFDMDRTGRWMIVANTDSNNAVVFAVNPGSGRLTPVGKPIPVENPACPRFLSRR